VVTAGKSLVDQSIAYVRPVETYRRGLLETVPGLSDEKIKKYNIKNK